ncbi:MAG TPA: XdhC family protein [Anaerolineales bacterium]|nr:XdhC family protein [Anaerolineales bacterium]
MTDRIFKELARLTAAQETAAFCVITSAKGSTPRQAGSKMIVYPDGQILGTVGGGELEHRVVEEAKLAMQTGQPKVVAYSMADPERGDPGVCGGQLEVYVEPILPRPAVIVVGAGHVGKAVAELAKWLGYYVVVSDDRPEFSSESHVPDADANHSGPMEAIPDEFTIHRQTYFVLTTRNVEVDAAGLPRLMETQSPFIGVIGSRRRWETTRSKLLEQGVPEEKIARIQSPIGLELHAETPAEIAVSIMAQIILVQRGDADGGDGGEPMAGKE